jgi:hypothetical protein
VRGSLLLGIGASDSDNPVMKYQIDGNIKRYIWKTCTNIRATVTASVNAMLGKEHEVFTWRR